MNCSGRHGRTDNAVKVPGLAKTVSVLALLCISLCACPVPAVDHGLSTNVRWPASIACIPLCRLSGKTDRDGPLVLAACAVLSNISAGAKVVRRDHEAYNNRPATLPTN